MDFHELCVARQEENCSSRGNKHLEEGCENARGLKFLLLFFLKRKEKRSEARFIRNFETLFENSFNRGVEIAIKFL